MRGPPWNGKAHRGIRWAHVFHRDRRPGRTVSESASGGPAGLEDRCEVERRSWPGSAHFRCRFDGLGDDGVGGAADAADTNARDDDRPVVEFVCRLGEALRQQRPSGLCDRPRGGLRATPDVELEQGIDRPVDVLGDRRVVDLVDDEQRERLVPWQFGVAAPIDESVELGLLGRAEKVVVTKDETTIVSGAGSAEDLQGRIAQIQAEIDNTDSDYDREKLQERLAKLSGGVAVLQVGAATEVELKEKKHRIEDAVSTTKAAIEEGVVAGGGVTLLRTQEAVLAMVDGLDADEAVGAKIVARSLQGPLAQIAENAGLEGGVVVAAVRELTGHEGLNARTGEYENLVDAGIIDAAKVTRSALQNASSIAGLFLTTEVVITDAVEADEG